MLSGRWALTNGLSTGRRRCQRFRTGATQLARKLRLPVDAVITSPPYHGAVDCYAAISLRCTGSISPQLMGSGSELLQSYIGRTKVAARHHLLQEAFTCQSGKLVSRRRCGSSRPRADAFRHYCIAMGLSIQQLAVVLKRGAPALFVVSHCAWKNAALNIHPTCSRSSQLRTSNCLSFWTIPSRTAVSYSRHNGASASTKICARHAADWEGAAERGHQWPTLTNRKRTRPTHTWRARGNGQGTSGWRAGSRRARRCVRVRGRHQSWSRTRSSACCPSSCTRRR